MKKLLFAVLTAALLLSACGRTPAAQPAAETEAPAAETPAAETPTLVSPALVAVLNQIKFNVQPGTAGSSLKAAGVTAELLDWAEEAPPQENIEATVAAWLSEQTPDTLALLPEQLSSLDYTVELLTEDYDSAAGLLSDAGLEGRGPWSEDAATAVRDLLTLLA